MVLWSGGSEEVRVSGPLSVIQPERTGDQGWPDRAERSEPRSGALDGRGVEATNAELSGQRSGAGLTEQEPHPLGPAPAPLLSGPRALEVTQGHG